MEIAKLIMAAIGLVTTRTREYQASQEDGGSEPLLSDKAMAIQDIFRNVKTTKMSRNFRGKVLEAFGVLLGEDLRLPDKKEDNTIYVPTHVLAHFIMDDPGHGEEPRELFMGSIMIDSEDDEELVPKLMNQKGKFFYPDADRVEFPTDEEISAFIKELPERVLRREFNFLC